MLTEQPERQSRPYGTGGFALGRPPVFQFAVGKKAINAYYYID